MRRMLRIFLGLGLGLSTILFVGTVVFWVRNVGHEEGWMFDHFKHRSDWRVAELAGQGISRTSCAWAIDGRLWLITQTRAPAGQSEPRIYYRRDEISGDKEQHDFDSVFQPGKRAWGGGTQRGWRFAGVGFWNGRSALDPRIGQPTHEDFWLAIPFWMLAAVFGLWPLSFTAWRLLRRRRYGTGLCPSCGYDLRATPDRCPECGTLIARPTQEETPRD